MTEYVVLITAIICGFLALIKENYECAFLCLGFAFILLCVITVFDCIERWRRKK
jgi:hypothetical protein